MRTGHLFCSRCQRQFSYEDRKYLHVHHRNGKKNDCRRSNLVVLCASCHQKEHHDHKILF
ncbi:HNH endonuclease [Selenomonas ruminantium]|uniref:HNH endonuclease n=1 Tax=Selenomonas ruminantium TaxID=971 RepID=UPI0034E94C64